MPTYDYACRACDHRFEIVQSFSEDSLTTCPSCEEDALRKVFSAAGIIFKGDGWHVKDYAGATAGTTSAPSDTPSSSSDSSSSTSSTSSTSSSSDSSSSSSSTSSTTTSSD